MGIRASITAVYEKDPKTGQNVLKGYKENGLTASQKKTGQKPKKGFGINTTHQKKQVVEKAIKIKEIKEKVLKRKSPSKKKNLDA